VSPPGDGDAAAVQPARGGYLSRPAAFVAVAAILTTFAAASSAPSPLYVVYQRDFRFSATTLTIIFAVYVVGLIASLLILGALSDHVGRRPVLAGAVALEMVALALFILADNTSMLLIARVVQGIATGVAFTTLSATLVDLNPPQSPGRAGVVNGVAPLSGLAVGALGCGLLVQYAPLPLRLVYEVLLAGMGVSLVLVAALPETSAGRPGALGSLIPRLGVPARIRPDFLAILPILVASWALAGLYFSLGPSIAAQIFALANHVIGGVVIFLLCGIGALTAFVSRNRPLTLVLDSAAILLAAGTALSLAGVEANLSVLAGIGTVVAGLGFGASALATFGTFARLALPAERGALFAVAYTIAYLAFSLPAVVAGFATTSVGLHNTSVVYSIVVIALSVGAFAVQRLRARRRAA
jgi:MFS family permease